jgi:hypothetical protein
MCERWITQCRALPVDLDHRTTGFALLGASTLQAHCNRLNKHLPLEIEDLLQAILRRTRWKCDNSYLLDLASRTQGLILASPVVYAAAMDTRLAHRFALVNALLFDMKERVDLRQLYDNARAWSGALPKKLKPGASAVAELLAIWAQDPQRRDAWHFLVDTEKMFGVDIPGHTKWKNSDLDAILNLAFQNVAPGCEHNDLELPANVSLEIS